MNLKSNILVTNAFMWVALIGILSYQTYLHLTGHPYYFLNTYGLPLITSACYMLGANFTLINLRIKKHWIAFLSALIVTIVESFFTFIVLVGLVTKERSFITSLIFLLITPSLFLIIASKLTSKICMIKEHFLGNLIGLTWVTGVFFLWATDTDGNGIVQLSESHLLLLSALLLIPSGLPHSFLFCKKIQTI